MLRIFYHGFEKGRSSKMEAMAAGLPCIVSDIRGNKDLIEYDKGGFLITPRRIFSGYSNAINKLKDNIELRNCHESEYNREKIKEFEISIIEQKLCKNIQIYCVKSDTLIS